MKCAVWTINLQLTWSLFFPWLTDTTESFERLCLVAALQSFQEGESKNFPLANIDIWICCKSKFWLAYTVSYTTGVASHWLGPSLSQFIPQQSSEKTVVELIKRKFFSKCCLTGFFSRKNYRKTTLKKWHGGELFIHIIPCSRPAV